MYEDSQLTDDSHHVKIKRHQTKPTQIYTSKGSFEALILEIFD